ncbi:MAG TPA: response regulator [Anaerolineae bacterium]|nr:response regulator [Anaerolineae bacterium]HXV99338.1 response regulator [Anaerolineae bacterium]
MSEFVQWVKAEWEALEGRKGEKYSTRRLSIEAGLSPNTLYQLLKHPEVKPSPETCHKLAGFFQTEPLLVLEMAGHVSAIEISETTSELEAALHRSDLQKLLLSTRDLPPADIQFVQQLVDQLRSKRREAEAQEVARGAAVALVVEDTPDARALYVHMLQAAGLKVLEASDGEKAVELIKTNGALIDVVLMDYRMPRMNGVEATRAIRQHFPDLPVLFVSHWDEPEMKDAAFASGAAEYLVAPVEYDKLVEAVLQVRQRSKAEVS